MLAYVFWHRPRDPEAREAYERANIDFHRSLAHNPPAGMLGSAFFRLPELPWLSAARAGGKDAADAGGYEDWYLVEDFTALGVLDEAAVGRGHRSRHEQIARRYGAGAGGIYGLREGRPHPGMLAEAPLAIWVDAPPGAQAGPLAEMLVDGVDPARASLWRRRLVLGPAPDYCLMAPAAPPGAAAGRLPAGWRALVCERQLLFDTA